MNGPWICDYCLKPYASKGGLTHHTSHCPERQDQVSRERERTQEKKRIAELEALLKEKEKQLEDERKSKQNPTIVNNFNNCTFISTQQYIQQENKLFTSFTDKITYELKNIRWNSLDAAKTGIKGLLSKIKQVGTINERRILGLLAAPEVEMEAKDNIDNQAVVDNIAKQLDILSDKMVTFVSSNLPSGDREKLTAQLKKQTIWELD
jgi:hypothetical protein